MNNYKSLLSQIFDSGSFPEDAFYIDKVFKNKKIIVYGAGESFHYFKEIVIKKYGYKPTVILDRKFITGDIFEGIPAYSPLSYQPSDVEKENGLVVICLGKQSYYDDVVQTLQKMGFKHLISLMDIYEIHNPFSLPYELEQKGFQYYIENRKHIECCFELFNDDESKEVFFKCMKTHLQRKPVAIPMCERTEQYTPKNIPLTRGYSRFIYCGVSLGEMKRIFIQIGKIKELICFEPDPNQYKLAAEYLSMHHKHIAEHVSVIPCAVYNEESVKPFIYSDTSFGSRILQSGDSWIQCVSIDHILPGFNPAFINMDIEGAELEALKGAENTIRANRPDLAVCVYHAPNHLWEIPLYIHNLGLDYRFYLRNYTSLTGETVLYATT